MERERWRRVLKGPELTSWGRCDFSTWLSCWAIVVGAVSGLGWGMWGWVFACSRCRAKVVDRVVTQPCHIPPRLDSNRVESSPRFARYHDAQLCALQETELSSISVRKTTLTSVLLCGANGTGHPRRFVSPDRDDLEEPGRLSFLARRGSVPFGELVLRRDLVPELFPPPSAGFLLRRVRVGIRQRCFRTS